MTSRPLLQLWIVSLALVLVGCDNPKPRPQAASRAPTPLKVTTYTKEQKEEGRRLSHHFECSRCHTATSKLVPAHPDKDCLGCHRSILEGSYNAPKELLASWSIHNLVQAPTLTELDKRMRAEWFIDYLMKPHDLRPNLGASMPRLPITKPQAQALAAFFELPQGSHTPPVGDLERGKSLLTSKGCLGCHSKIEDAPKTSVLKSMTTALRLDAQTLAPHLGAVQGRMPQGVLVQWLKDPKSIKHDARMPNLGLTDQEASDLAAYLSSDKLPQPPKPSNFAGRRPVLKRPISFEEVHTKIFGKLCMHCHSDPAYNRGDGGPGNTGGFGFAAKGLDLSTEEGALWGVSGANGEEYSILEPVDKHGTPRIVRHLVARHFEERGRPIQGVLGMPLGHPALSLEEIQLIETWATQTRAAQREDDP